MRVLILGGGHAGGAAALALRDLGFAGEVTILGDEAEPPYERPPLSKEMLTGDADAPPPVCADWSARDVTLLLGRRAASLDRRDRTVTLADGTLLPFDHLILATGGRPRRPPFPPHPRTFTLRDAADARAIRAAALGASRAVVLGGGVIGLEAAASLRRLGLDVSVVEAAARPMSRNVPPDMAARLAAIHEAAGIRLHLGRRAGAIALDPLAVTLDDGTTLPADLVVIGIGIVPETALADGAGLGGPDGVPVDLSYRTADPRVLAIGDVASVEGTPRQESWAHAASSARAAARAILGLAPEPRPIPWFWTDQHGHRLQVAGNPLAADRAVPEGPNAVVYVRGEVPVGVAALDAPRDFARLRRGLGR